MEDYLDTSQVDTEVAMQATNTTQLGYVFFAVTLLASSQLKAFDQSYRLQAAYHLDIHLAIFGRLLLAVIGRGPAFLYNDTRILVIVHGFLRYLPLFPNPCSQ